MSKNTHRTRTTTAVAGAIAAGGLLTMAGGVYAALSATATNATPQAVTSGTLSLTMAGNGAGLTTTVSDMAPGDAVQRFVTLTNGGSLDGSGLTLQVTDSTTTATLLTTDATRGLRVAVDECSQAWDATTHLCGGTAKTLLTSTPVASFTAPASLSTSAFAHGTSRYLRLSLALPDSTETTLNGVPQAGAGTIQGLAAALTWSFTEGQRLGSTTAG